MFKKNKKLIIIPLIIIITTIFLLILKFNNYNSWTNIINENWKIDLPKNYMSETQIEGDHYSEGLKVIDITYDSSNISEIYNNYEWISDYNRIITEVKKCKSITHTDSILGKINFSENKKLHFKYKDNAYLILVLDEENNILRII